MVRVLIAAVIVCAAAGLVFARPGDRERRRERRQCGDARSGWRTSWGQSEGVAEGREVQATLSLRGTSRQRVRAAYRNGYVAGANDVFGGLRRRLAVRRGVRRLRGARAGRDHYHRLACRRARPLPARLSHVRHSGMPRGAAPVRGSPSPCQAAATPSAAARSAAMSSLRIPNMHSIARLARSGSGSVRAPSVLRGTTCHDRP